MDTTAIAESRRRGEELITGLPADSLAHYGIPGMKWGVRRSQATLDRLAGRTSSSDKKKKKSGSKSGSKGSGSDRREARKKERQAKRKVRSEGRVERAKVREQGKLAVEKAKAERAVRDVQTGADKKTDTRKSIKDMTDRELQDRVNRLNLEKQYKTLTKKPKSTKDVVKDFAVKQTGKFATQAADAMVKKAVGKLVGDSATKAGEKVIKQATESTKSVQMPKAVESVAKGSAGKAIAKLAGQAVPKTRTKSRALDDLIDVNKMKTVKDIRRAYSYTGRRRLNKDRKVTNRRK